MTFLIFLIGGDTLKFLLKSFSITYSSKSSLNSFTVLETFNRVVSILEPKNLGAKESLVPPFGVPTLAHEKSKRLSKRRKIIFFIDNNNNQFKVYGSKPYEVYESALLKLIEGPVVKKSTGELTDIFKYNPTVTLREFEVFYNLSTEAALMTLNKMVTENQLIKTETKAGPIWKEVNL